MYRSQPIVLQYFMWACLRYAVGLDLSHLTDLRRGTLQSFCQGRSLARLHKLALLPSSQLLNSEGFENSCHGDRAVIFGVDARCAVSGSYWQQPDLLLKYLACGMSDSLSLPSLSGWCQSRATNALLLPSPPESQRLSLLGHSGVFYLAS